MPENEDIFPYFANTNKWDGLPIIEVIPNTLYIHMAGPNKQHISHMNIGVVEASPISGNPGNSWKSVHDSKEALEGIITACQYILQEYYPEKKEE